MSTQDNNTQQGTATHAATDRPSPWVMRFAALIPAGEVLDLACGGGRHSRLLAARGHPVLAVDRNAESLALAAGAGIRTLQLDLESGDENACWPFGISRFAGIVVTNYLHRPLLAAMIAGLAPGGVLIYETFAQGNGQFGKPSSPAFLLMQGELLQIAQQNSLQIIAFEDGYIADPRAAMVQRICALKTDGSAAPQSLRLD
jgi:SAM-dependent methyltransferase